jgi:hypothetical protein
VSVPPPPVPGGQPPVGPPNPYGQPSVAQPNYGPPPLAPAGYGPPPVAQPNYGPPPVAPAGYGQPPVPQKPKRRWVRMIIPIVVIVIGGVFAVVNYTQSPDSSKVGDCLTVSQFKQGVEPTKAACADPAANVLIGAKVDDSKGSCPDGDYDEYSVTGRPSYKMCLVINAKQGDCLSNFLSKTEGYQKVACSDPMVDAEIVKAVAGTASKALCDGTDATHAAVYPQPATTLCLKVKTA